jgi:hypothetical protein
MAELGTAIVAASVHGASVSLHALAEDSGAVHCELWCNGKRVIVEFLQSGEICVDVPAAIA